MEMPAIEGDSPVGEIVCSPLLSAYQSSTEAVELRVKLGRPLSKAKYYITTDSAQVGRLNDEKHLY